MPSWQGKSKGTPLGYRIFVAVLRKGGLSPAYWLLRFVALYYFIFSRATSRAILDFFRHRMGMGPWTAWKKLYRNYYLFGQSLIDRVAVMSGAGQSLTFDFDGEQHLREITAMQRGGLLLSAHIGNWEIAGHLLKRLGTPIHIVMYDGEHQQIKQYLDSVTGQRNVSIIVIRDSLSHIYEISEALRKNELVCMHADRFLEGNKTLEATFLGKPALFPMGPFVLASKFKVPVCFVFALKETKLHYHFFSSPVHEYKDLSKETGMRMALEDFIMETEAKVRQYPEQWYNYYNFWKA